MPEMEKNTQNSKNIQKNDAKKDGDSDQHHSKTKPPTDTAGTPLAVGNLYVTAQGGSTNDDLTRFINYKMDKKYTTSWPFGTYTVTKIENNFVHVVPCIHRRSPQSYDIRIPFDKMKNYQFMSTATEDGSMQAAHIMNEWVKRRNEPHWDGIKYGSINEHNIHASLLLKPESPPDPTPAHWGFNINWIRPGMVFEDVSILFRQCSGRGYIVTSVDHEAQCLTFVRCSIEMDESAKTVKEPQLKQIGDDGAITSFKGVAYRCSFQSFIKPTEGIANPNLGYNPTDYFKVVRMMLEPRVMKSIEEKSVDALFNYEENEALFSDDEDESSGGAEKYDNIIWRMKGRFNGGASQPYVASVTKDEVVIRDSVNTGPYVRLSVVDGLVTEGFLMTGNVRSKLVLCIERKSEEGYSIRLDCDTKPSFYITFRYKGPMQHPKSKKRKVKKSSGTELKRSKTMHGGYAEVNYKKLEQQLAKQEESNLKRSKTMPWKDDYTDFDPTDTSHENIAKVSEAEIEKHEAARMGFKNNELRRSVSVSNEVDENGLPWVHEGVGMDHVDFERLQKAQEEVEKEYQKEGADRTTKQNIKKAYKKIVAKKDAAADTNKPRNETKVAAKAKFETGQSVQWFCDGRDNHGVIVFVMEKDGENEYTVYHDDSFVTSLGTETGPTHPENCYHVLKASMEIDLKKETYSEFRQHPIDPPREETNNFKNAYKKFIARKNAATNKPRGSAALELSDDDPNAKAIEHAMSYNIKILRNEMENFDVSLFFNGIPDEQSVSMDYVDENLKFENGEKFKIETKIYGKRMENGTLTICIKSEQIEKFFGMPELRLSSKLTNMQTMWNSFEEIVKPTYTNAITTMCLCQYQGWDKLSPEQKKEKQKENRLKLSGKMTVDGNAAERRRQTKYMYVHVTKKLVLFVKKYSDSSHKSRLLKPCIDLVIKQLKENTFVSLALASILVTHIDELDKLAVDKIPSITEWYNNILSLTLNWEASRDLAEEAKVKKEEELLQEAVQITEKLAKLLSNTNKPRGSATLDLSANDPNAKAIVHLNLSNGLKYGTLSKQEYNAGGNDTIDKIQAFIGGYFQEIVLRDGTIILCDEEATLKNIVAINEKADFLIKNTMTNRGPIYGNIVHVIDDNERCPTSIPDLPNPN